MQLGVSVDEERCLAARARRPVPALPGDGRTPVVARPVQVFLLRPERRSGQTKITMEVDCSPEEARRFLGLPDVVPLQEEALAVLRGRAAEAAGTTTPEALARFWPFSLRCRRCSRAPWAAPQGGPRPRATRTGASRPRASDGRLSDAVQVQHTLRRPGPPSPPAPWAVRIRRSPQTSICGVGGRETPGAAQQ
jgi:hypothetical protein